MCVNFDFSGSIVIEFVSVCRLKTLIHISIYLLGLSINKTVIYHSMLHNPKSLCRYITD